MFDRAAIYFDEVARRGSVRKAAERLHIAPSAVDRQILQLEERIGAPLFERLPQGLRMTAAGEMLVEAVRRWRRDFGRVQSQIKDLQGLYRGEVSLALVEGAVDFITDALCAFRARYPGIQYRMQVCGSQAVDDLVLSGEFDLGLTFNPPKTHALRAERSLIYQIGAVVPAGHPLADKDEVSFADCDEWGVVAPDDSISIRPILEGCWQAAMGEPLRHNATANSITLVKAMVRSGIGVGVLTRLNILSELRAGEFVYVPFSHPKIPLSVLSLVVQSGRALSVAASAFLQELDAAMQHEDEPSV
ncbi:LysR family transcriptional regulator [Caulobacter hibisci]|uniref:LysR family transcriptional regulator n=1 Tax=Caulobacter hibisci TaxID=2035993 RepID=A0ABS0T2R4_9CAUL|nr:LysR family transcriptional regulator [Caulobacter hibisci]MBI1685147.1 LysR family transcriptional regulator [Caulobacter hibisci]